MNRYLPPIARAPVPDLAYVFGFVWAGPDVRLGRAQHRAGAHARSRDLGGGDVDLGHRQQDRPVPDPVRHDARRIGVRARTRWRHPSRGLYLN